MLKWHKICCTTSNLDTAIKSIHKIKQLSQIYLSEELNITAHHL